MRLPGFWSDVVYTPDGFRLITQAIGAYEIWAYDEQGRRVWTAPANEGLWHLRACALPDGTIAMVGQGHQTPGLHYTIRQPNGSCLHRRVDHPHVAAQAGVIIRAKDAETWELAVQFTPRHWCLAWLSKDGTLTQGPTDFLPVWPGGDGSSSQGFLQFAADGSVVWTDPNRIRTINGRVLFLATESGSGWVGQFPDGPGIVTLLPDGRAGVVEPEMDAFEPRILRVGDRYGISARSLRGLALFEVVGPGTALAPFPAPKPPVPPPAPPIPPPAPEPPKETSVRLPNEVQEVILRFAQKFPLPKGSDEESAAWTHKLAQQLNFSFPGKGWGHKSAGNGRPHSADVICTNSPFIGWDIILSAGSPDARLNPGADSIDLTGQAYEAVEAINHLGASDPVPGPTPPPPQPPPAGNIDAEILAELKKQTAILMGIAQGLSALPAQLDKSIGELKATFDKGVKIRF